MENTGIKVGVLGQWASGKSTAARTLIEHLGGEQNVVFILDVIYFAGQAVNHILELGTANVTKGVEENGHRWYAGKDATVWLKPGENWGTIELPTLRFDVHGNVLPEWLDNARVSVGHEIREQPENGKPVVIEAGFGKHPLRHTLRDFFDAMHRAGVAPQQVKWIIVEASYKNRAERNEKRKFGPPPDIFRQYAEDGGDLQPEDLERLAAQGVIIKRVLNNHNDVARFKKDVIAAYENMFNSA